MSKKEDETYGSGSAAAASVNSSKSKSGSGFSSFSQNNGVQNSGSFQTSQEAANNNANSSIASVSYTSSPNISASGFSSLSSKSLDPSFSQGQSSDGESFGNATSVQSVSVPENASFAPVMLEASEQASFVPRTLPEIEQYIIFSARQRGIDPNIAVKVAKSEGLSNVTDYKSGWQSNVMKNGRRETSYGPFQLLVGDGKSFPKGMGNDFIRETGLDPSDPSTIREQIDFALDNASKKGWGAWYGAKKVGVSRYDGLNGSMPLGYQPNRNVDIAYNNVGLPEGGDIPAPILEETDQNAPISTEMAYATTEINQNVPFDEVLTDKSVGGLEALNPSGSVKNRNISTASIIPVHKYNPSAKRSNMPSSSVVDDFAKSVALHFGPYYSVGVYSGQEPKGVKPVGSSENHPSGLAADMDIIAPDGKRVTGKDPEDAKKMRNVHIDMAVLKYPVGFGEGYMKEGRTHVGGPSWKLGWGRNYSNTSLDPDLKTDLQRARETGNNWKWNVPIPADRDGKEIEVANAEPLPASPSGNVERQDLQAQSPIQRVDKYTASPNQAPEQKGLTGKQKFMAGAIDVGSSFIPVAGTAISLANGVAAMTGNKTLGQRLVSGKGFNVGPSTRDYGQGETTDYSEIVKLRKLEEERLAAEEANAQVAAQTPTPTIDRYLTASNDVWRPNASERFGFNANNYR